MINLKHISIGTIFFTLSLLLANSQLHPIYSLDRDCEFGVEDSFGECCENTIDVWQDIDNDGLGDVNFPATACLEYAGWVENSEDVNDEIFCLSNLIDACDICDGNGKSCIGCMDETAINFDESASIHDEFSCIYASDHIWHVSDWGSDEFGSGTVDNPFITIPHAVNVASEHDTILVHSGTFPSNIDLGEKNLFLTSMYCFLPDSFYIQNTILDGMYESSVVRYNGGQDETSVLCGFTITNGVGSYINDNNKLRGGGVMCHNSDPQLNHLIITGNSAYYGGGIQCHSAEPEITHSLITQNITLGGFGSEGAGVFCWNANPSFYNVIISHNESLEEDGGGIVCNYGSSPYLENVKIDNNHCYYRGGGMFCWNNSNPTLINVEITRNTASTHAAGVHLDNHCDPIFQNVLIAQNYLTGGMDGGGIYVYNGSEPIFINSTIADNHTNGEGGGLLLLNGSNTLLFNTILWGNEPEQFWVQGGNEHITLSHCSVDGHNPLMESDNPSIITWLENNMELNPYFAFPDTLNYSLTQDSECIDMGSSSIEWNGDDLTIEIFNGMSPDLGYMESDYSTALPGDYNLDNVVDILDIIGIVNLIVSGETPTYFEFLLCDFNQDGIINILDIIYLINIILG